MTQQAATGQEYLIPDEIARAAVLPGSYTDEENTVFPAYAWLRANNPLGRRAPGLGYSAAGAPNRKNQDKGAPEGYSNPDCVSR